MRRWLADQLGEPWHREVVVLLDPDGLLHDTDLESLAARASVRAIEDWFELRRAYEVEGRGRAAGDQSLVLVVRAGEFQEARDLPYDIEQLAQVVRLRVPVPNSVAPVVITLPPDLQERVVTAFRRPTQDPLNTLLAAAWGVSIPAAGAAEAHELEAVVRLRTDASVPASMWSQLRSRLLSPTAQLLAQEPPDFGRLQAGWEDWLRSGEASSWAGTFHRLGVRVLALFHAGFLKTVPALAEDLPAWAGVGARDRSWRERIEALLDARPDPFPPGNLQDWIMAAEWWGQVRSSIALGSPGVGDLSDRAWQLWEELDTAFGAWLRSSLGQLMFSVSQWPTTVDRISSYLARRIRDGKTKRVLLIVLDGMAFGQWTMIRTEAKLSTAASGGVVAMVPTLTSISRQAIFAGELPRYFPSTLRSTANDAQTWLAFWGENGVRSGEVVYHRTPGRLPRDVPELGTAVVAGIVVDAVDEIVHGSKVMGDPQALASIEAWIRHGFLRSLVDYAAKSGFEVWVTADHGNLEAVASGRVQEGLAVESAGLRVRWYATAALRENARADGIVWDPPGLPEGSIYPLFAPGRTGYFGGTPRITHGGFSLDEVIVPLVQVVP